MTRFMQHRAPHVSMEAMQSTSWPAADEAFPDTHLSHDMRSTLQWDYCSLACNNVTWSDRRPAYIMRFRNLMPSLRARGTGRWDIHYSIVFKTTAGRPLTVGRFKALYA